ncbi:MAG: hypothetical protein KBD63_05125 [Bacteriovoracaceae bacterium]|nr:hypothetical protein [Bacteriovoracaceae bacterium]
MRIVKRITADYIMLSFLLLVLIYSYNTAIFCKNFSFLSKDSFYFYIKAYFPVLSFFILAVGSLYFKKNKRWIFFFLIQTSIYAIIALQENFSKVTFVLFLIFILVSFYFFIWWEEELHLAPFQKRQNPYALYTSNNKFNIFVTNIKGDMQVATLINYDARSCLISIKEGNNFLNNKLVTLKFSFEGNDFSQMAYVVSKNTKSKMLGLLFDLNSQDNGLGWADFYQIAQKRSSS